MPFNIFGLFGLVTVCAILCVLVRQSSPEHAFAVTLACVCVTATYLLSQLGDIVAEMLGIADTAGLANLDSLFKAVSISIIGQIAADVCNDYGQGSLANVIAMAGRFAILIISLPLFRDLLNIALALVQQS